MVQTWALSQVRELRLSAEDTVSGEALRQEACLWGSERGPGGSVPRERAQSVVNGCLKDSRGVWSGGWWIQGRGAPEGL